MNVNNTTSSNVISQRDIPLTDLIRNAGVVPTLAIVLGVKALIGIIGIVFNTSLTIVTIRTKSLHGPTNILIGINSLCLATYELSFIFSWFIAVTGRNLIPLMTCFYWLAVPASMKYMTLTLMLFVGLDRLICIQLPTWHNNRFYNVYFAAIIGFCLLIAIWSMAISYKVAITIPDMEVQCTVSDVSQKWASDAVFMCALILNAFSIVVYIIFGIVFMRAAKKNKTADFQYTQSIFKSLLLIMVADFLGWGSNSIVQFLKGVLNASNLLAIEKWCVLNINGCILALATAAEAPILYICSKEYRKAYGRQLGIGYVPSSIHHRTSTTFKTRASMVTVVSYNNRH
ncbi:serpentine type 7TM GPCR chemoreceptor srsx domain-containing protein [Ditylenchus destructor]|uniref:Serpentine type 7TM GPCR chemoreceptor srsx domain-containing protein n=1 Tax=Ditylenchus destructor TaxID=166010 RepID=A0AAD4QU57_9BILA|nr:serpentine type 7TM GPCR chemoreceptor srsx domain-containing protein [Ditylenchus destructor]